MGLEDISAAPAPSESIQRRKSFSKPSPGYFSNLSIRAWISDSKFALRIKLDANSEPAHTAVFDNPNATFIYPYFIAVMSELHTPAVVITSQSGQPSSPCTICPCAGLNWSG